LNASRQWASITGEKKNSFSITVRQAIDTSKIINEKICSAFFSYATVLLRIETKKRYVQATRILTTQQQIDIDVKQSIEQPNERRK
jgi:hypothetical protein